MKNTTYMAQKAHKGWPTSLHDHKPQGEARETHEHEVLKLTHPVAVAPERNLTVRTGCTWLYYSFAADPIKKNWSAWVQWNRRLPVHFHCTRRVRSSVSSAFVYRHC